MKLSTIKTLFGFFSTMIGKYTPIKVGKNTIEGIYNYLNYNENLCTSGQPTEFQFSLIKEAGYSSVINLAPHNAENSLTDEALTLSTLGLEYVHIPVDFQKPTEEKVKSFYSFISLQD